MMPYSKRKRDQIESHVKAWGVEATAEIMGVGVESIKRALRAQTDDAPRSGKKPVLVIPDLHAPYHHPQAIQFLQWVHKTRGCDKSVVCSGDMLDFHSMSRHVHETDAWSPKREYEKALEFTAELCAVFPKGDFVLGNHDLIPQRQMKELGLLTSLLKNNNDLYGMSSGWNIHQLYHVIDPDGWDVLVEHGIGSGGKYGCANTSKEKRCSYVQGHIHSAAAVIYTTNYKSTTFGMNVGCLVDSDSLAQRYGKYSTRKGVLGCGVVHSGSHAEFVPMNAWPEFIG